MRCRDEDGKRRCDQKKMKLDSGPLVVDDSRDRHRNTIELFSA